MRSPSVSLVSVVGVDRADGCSDIGTDFYTDTQLGYAYQSAANNGMKVFISYDMNWFKTNEGTQIGQMIGHYAALPAQLFVNGAAVASTFSGDGLNVSALRSAAGRPVFFIPNFHPGQGNFSEIDGALNWMAWPNNGRNKAPDGYGNLSVAAGDSAYLNALAGKPYLAPVSPWFSTREFCFIVEFYHLTRASRLRT
jgi:hypothetical protein